MASVIRDKVYVLLVLFELSALACLAIFLGVVTFRMEDSIDRLLAQPQGVSKEEFERVIHERDREITELQRLTHTHPPHAHAAS
jgi:hypothetical protein